MGYLLSFIILVSAIIIIYISDYKNNGIFCPPIFFSFLIILGFVIPYPLVEFMGDLNPYYLFWPYAYNNYEDSMNKSLFIALLSLWLFFIGFRIAMRMKFSNNAVIKTNDYTLSIKNKTFLPFTILIGFICLLFIIISFIKAGGIGIYFAGNENRVEALEGKNIFALAQNSFAGIFILWYYINVNKKSAFFKFAFGLTAFVFLLITNSKSPLFVLLISIFIIHYYRVKKIGFFNVFYISISFILCLISWELFFREFLVVGEVVTVGKDLTIFENILLKFGDFFIGNFMQLQTTSIIVDSYPNNFNYLNGSSLLMVVLIFLPRTLFPNKPFTAAGDLTLSIWPEKFRFNGTTMPPGFLGELYMNFSWFGVFLGTILVGFIYGFLWKRFVESPNDLSNSIASVISISLMLHFFRGEFSSPFVLGFFFYFPIFFNKYLIKAKHICVE